MGQYYLSAVLKHNFGEANIQPVECGIYPHDFGNGAKLMEFSYLRNNFVNATMQLIALHNGRPFVMCGDYADENFYVNELGKHRNCYEIALDEKKIISKEKLEKLAKERNICPNYRYIINEDKKEYLDLNDYLETEKEIGSWAIHPLPLLCADGCFRGSGDYAKSDINSDKVGYWKYDCIRVSNIPPDEKMGYEKIFIEFREIY